MPYHRRMSSFPHDSVRAIHWIGDGLRLLDQRRLPDETRFLSATSVDDVTGAIRDMTVRGAPAIGIAAAYGVVLAARARIAADERTWKQAIEEDLRGLEGARPTAINLRWAIGRMRGAIGRAEGIDAWRDLLAEARAIHEEDIAANRRMGELGAALLATPSNVLTHCNAGSLATGGYGTALGVIRCGYGRGAVRQVYADETRPWLQGSRLTAWELLQDRIPVRLIADGAASYAMQQGKVDWVIVGADRVAANGDVANKIGTYSLALSARHHGVGFMVVAPTSTIDLATARGDQIPIESRAPDEILALCSRRIAAGGADAWNPVFDVTPADLIDVLVTERGVARRPTPADVAALAAP
jgi:methylthioribose-1-phosphate isomerase